MGEEGVVWSEKSWDEVLSVSSLVRISVQESVFLAHCGPVENRKRRGGEKTAE